MTPQEILLPLFAEVILTFLLLFWLAPLRARDFNAGVARPDNVSLREPNWSQRALQVSYAYSNQFELPVLFYVLTILEYVTHNDIRVRGAFFAVSAIVLAVMWAIYILEVLTVPRL